MKGRDIMILDILEDKKTYLGLDSKFQKAFKFLQESDLEHLQIGKYEIEGEDIYAMVQAYTTKPIEEGKWEAHRKYIDIQYIVKGAELVGWATLDGLEVSQEYNSEKDVLFLKKSENWSALKLRAKHYAIFFPEDAHMPGVCEGSPDDVKKVVVKIKI